MYYEAQNTMN